jgi:hypothetical protein
MPDGESGRVHFLRQLQVAGNSLPKSQEIIFYWAWPGEASAVGQAAKYQEQDFTNVRVLKGGVEAGRLRDTRWIEWQRGGQRVESAASASFRHSGTATEIPQGWNLSLRQIVAWLYHFSQHRRKEMTDIRSTVFMSCGQAKGEEEATAKSIGKKLEDLGFNFYIAVQEQTPSRTQREHFSKFKIALRKAVGTELEESIVTW